MGYKNDLVCLGNLISDAKDLIEMASDVAKHILSDDLDPEPDWPAMRTLIDRLAILELCLSDLPGAEMAGAIASARRYLGEMSDWADGISH